MKLITAIGIALTLAAGTVLAQCPGCPNASGCSSMSGQAGGLSGLILPNLAGDTIKLSEHVGMMPMVMLLVGTGEASGRAADVTQAARDMTGIGSEIPDRVPSRDPMFVYVIAAGPKSARTFAKSHELTGLVLVDQKKAALAAAMAETLPLALFIDQSGRIVKAEAEISTASVSKGVKALVQTQEKLVDPVCGMIVTKEHAAAKSDYQGKTYYFCSTACRDNFVKSPQKYLAQ